MFGAHEQHEANIATNAGFPGVHSSAALGVPSPNTAQAIYGARADRDNTALLEGLVAPEVGNGVNCEAAIECDAGGANGHVRRPDSITAGLPDVGQRFEEVTEVEKIYGGDDVGNTEPLAEEGREKNNEPFDPTTLADDDYLDFMFKPLPKENIPRLPTGQTHASLLHELLRPGSDIYGPQAQDGGRAAGNNETEPMSMSDEEYIDQVFMPISAEDKKKLSSKQTRESLFKELLGSNAAVNGAEAREAGASEDIASMRGGLNAAETDGLKTASNEALEALGSAANAQLPDLMEWGVMPSQSQGGAPHHQEAQGEVAHVPKAPRQRSQGDPSRPVKRAKRKRTPRKKEAKSAQEGQPRPQKRRRTRVEDMDPADVHACDFEGCGKRFARRYNLTVHQRAHRNEYTFRCDVPGCGKPFMWHSSLARHLRVHEKGLKSGGRKQRGKRSRARTTSMYAVEPAGAGAGSSPGANEQANKLENMKALVSTLNFDKTIMVLMGQKDTKIENDTDVNAHIEELWQQFAHRHQQLVGTSGSPIQVTRELFSLMCNEILVADRADAHA